MLFVDLKPQFKIIKKNLLNDFKHILKNSNFQNDSFSLKLNSMLSNYSKSYALACNSGSDALYIALKALGVSKNHEVIISSFGFKAVAKAVIMTQATPIFVDLLQKDSFAIDHKQIVAHINKKTKAIISISLFGSMQNVKPLLEINKKFNIPIIEDAAQSFGTHFKNQFFSCSTFTAAITSFYPSKLLGSAGSAGALFTNDEYLFKQFKSFIYNQNSSFKNFKIDEIQAAAIINKFKIFDDIIKFQRHNALLYINHFNNFNSKHLKIPKHVYGDSFSVFNLLSDKRFNIINALNKNNIPSRIYYDYLQHQLFKQYHKNYNQNFKNSIYFKNSIFAIPLYFKIKKKQQLFIINTIKSALDSI